MRRFKKLYVDKSKDDWMRFEEINFFIESSKYILEAIGRPCIADDNRMVWLEYKDDDEVTIKKGQYIIGGKLYTVSADFDWDFGGSNTYSLGVNSSEYESWYYLYAVLDGSDVKVGASLSAPTSLFKNSLTIGSSIYQPATYLGAIYSSDPISGKILSFYHCGGNFYFAKPISSVSSTSYISEDGTNGTGEYHSKTIRVPETAIFSDLLFMYHMDSGASAAYGYLFPRDVSPAYRFYMTNGYTQNIDNHHQLARMPLPIPQTVYMRDSDSNSNNEVKIYEIGFVDKFLR